MSTFFAKLSEINTSDSSSSTTHRPHNNAHAVPTPVDISSTYRLLAESYQHILTDVTNPSHSAFLERLINDVLSRAESPPKEISGVPQSFLDELERVPKKSLKKGDVCPICGEEFLSDEYPLVVVLPCHDSHRFDMDCIAPWLKLQATCPLDRKEVMKRKSVPVVVDKEDEEEDYDDMIA